ncbi:uncharacterized protein LOC18430973 isoform X1 [Amborella trichopoda]|uniref:uncharacterized protein LOC18430973 isoform X1 n=1 Tax=Amborella trichopoda TaxID=13333 RepID=UPI0005D34CE6|nr:uncharacterized protein LOC18430973 isoform X1 [Amborella trichopoda]|eukprot:XP_011622142.1 uncharacterized protein LOC18430973 isoform X1 [Amborella trichopoda]
MEKQVNSGVTYAQIDAFTDRMFGGNPAAICYLPEERTHEWMQLVAKDFNLSETAFLLKIPNTHSNNEFSLRWFTPKVEVDLCGHATLASAHFLFSQHGGLLDTKTIVFHTRSGILTAKRVGDGGRLIELDFPLIPISECDADDLELVKSALGSADIVWAGKPGGHGYLVEVSSTDELKSLKPDFQKMLVFGGRGDLIVTAAGGHDAQLDFTSRFFCPKAGILEDPVTGSAHCVLAPYWASKLQKDTLNAYQASERGGHLCVAVDRLENRVRLQGHAVTVMKGVLLDNGSY